MKYREPKEIIIRDRERFYLVPIPNADGYWMLCHPAVMAPCPECSAAPGVPCTSNRGHVVLTARQLAGMFAVLEKRPIAQSRIAEIHRALMGVRLHRSKPHEKRIVRWRDLGLNNVGARKKGRVPMDHVRHLQRLHTKAGAVLDKLEGDTR